MKSNFQKRFSIALEKRDKTMTDIAKETGISKGSMSQYANGVYNPNQEKVYLIAKSLGVSPAWLMGFDVPMMNVKLDKTQSIPIPLIGQIAAGVPILAEENIDDYFYMDKSIKADFCLRIKGDSMIDEGIYEDDIVFIRSQPCIENGEIGAVVIGDEATLKRVYKGDDTVILQPANRNYKAKTYTGGDIHIAGKLVAVLNIRS